MKNYIISVNGKSYDVTVEEVGGSVATPVMQSAPAVAPQAPKAAPQASAPANGTKVEAPMPGTILKLNVKVGDTVNEGQAIAVLEAMKMENDIPAPCAGKVVSVNVNVGGTVETGTVIAVIG
ncbi:MAG: biotin/lipoyl-binding protein [Ruminococcaceae bacterium]|nr:biotin/lipoyl-binding protein [Oscillospiraceae bacterium]